MYPTYMGAITPLYAAVNLELTREDSGAYFIPWARKGIPRDGAQDPELAMKLWELLEEQAGTLAQASA